jgi:hypothetical protein
MEQKGHWTFLFSVGTALLYDAGEDLNVEKCRISNAFSSSTKIVASSTNVTQHRHFLLCQYPCIILPLRFITPTVEFRTDTAEMEGPRK